MTHLRILLTPCQIFKNSLSAHPLRTFCGIEYFRFFFLNYSSIAAPRVEREGRDFWKTIVPPVITDFFYIPIPCNTLKVPSKFWLKFNANFGELLRLFFVFRFLGIFLCFQGKTKRIKFT